MKTVIFFTAMFLICSPGHSQKLPKKTIGKVTPKPPVKPVPTNTPKPEPTVVATDTAATTMNTEPSAVNTQAIKTYNNYDFIPGDTVVFEDHFEDDQTGEFPTHWNLGAGQAVMNMIGGQRALLLTAGNGAHVSPLIKSPVYFSDAFTIEFDWYFNGSYGPRFYFYETSKDAKAANHDLGQLWLDGSSAGVTMPDVELSGSFPAEITGEEHFGQWHHIAVACKKNQLKIYVDQHRVCVVPNLGAAPHAFDIEGIGDETTPIVMANFRVARGAGMNMLGQKFTAAKIVTHGINFDIDKATIKPESMGTLNMIVGVLKDNPEIKFEIDGHTDNSGGAPHNMTLSQQRAASVKAQLTAMGIDAARLTTKGFGSTKPISDNTTSEGKANNRRVEFVKN